LPGATTFWRKLNLTRALGCLFIMGGTVRIIATRRVFAAFGIESLWAGHVYFLYIYKVLGAFVVLTGLLLWSLGGGNGWERKGVRMMKWGMIFVGLVMLGAGLAAGLSLLFYVADVVFAWFTALALAWEERRLSAFAS
jgi:hypothetical protein